MGTGRFGRKRKGSVYAGQTADVDAALTTFDLLRALGWLVRHDVPWPGKQLAVIDHLLVGPPGVFVVVDDPNATDVDPAAPGSWQVEADRALEAATDVAAALPGVPVTPVICFRQPEPFTAVAGSVFLCTLGNVVEVLSRAPERINEVILGAVRLEVNAGLHLPSEATAGQDLPRYHVLPADEVEDDAADEAEEYAEPDAVEPAGVVDEPEPSPEPDAEALAAEKAAAEQAEREEQERLAAEAARQEQERPEQERLAAEQAAAERAEREEQERLEQERLAAEQAAAEQAEREEQERRAAEEAARQEEVRLEQERVAAEQAEREEQERLAAEEEAARQEQARLEQERLEQERLAAERAERQEQERLEQERLAAEQAAAERAERERQERLAAEEAARQEQARLEQERLAMEEAVRQERERLDAEEASRHEDWLAAEHAEAQRLQAARMAADAEEAGRLEQVARDERAAGAARAHDEEQRRLAAEQTARQEQERLAAETVARQEQRRQDDEGETEAVAPPPVPEVEAPAYSPPAAVAQADERKPKREWSLPQGRGLVAVVLVAAVALGLLVLQGPIGDLVGRTRDLFTERAPARFGEQVNVAGTLYHPDLRLRAGVPARVPGRNQVWIRFTAHNPGEQPWVLELSRVTLVDGTGINHPARARGQLPGRRVIGARLRVASGGSGGGLLLFDLPRDEPVKQLRLELGTPDGDDSDDTVVWFNRAP